MADDYFGNETHRWLESGDKNYARHLKTAVIRGISERDDGVLFVIPTYLDPSMGGEQWRQQLADGCIDACVGLSHRDARELAQFILDSTPATGPPPRGNFDA
jgi:hypothetical protein